MRKRSYRMHSGRPFWRKLVGIVAIYALVLQPLMLTMLGSHLAQAAVQDQITFAQLCQHEADGSPVAPSDDQKHPAEQHCTQCFSGAFQLLDAPEGFNVAVANRQFRSVPEFDRALRLSSSQYSLASPRGPPLSA